MRSTSALDSVGPVPKVSPLVSGDTKLEGSERGVVELPPGKCIFQPSQGMVGLSRPSNEVHTIFADRWEQVIT